MKVVASPILVVLSRRAHVAFASSISHPYQLLTRSFRFAEPWVASCGVETALDIKFDVGVFQSLVQGEMGMARAGVGKGSATKRVSTKGDYFDRKVRKAKQLPFEVQPSRMTFDTALFGRGKKKLNDDEWSGLLSILDIYRIECGYPLQGGSSVGDVRKRVRSCSTSLRLIRKKLSYFEGALTPDSSFPRTLFDFIALTDNQAVAEALPSSGASFTELLDVLDSLIARLGFVEEFIAAPDFRFALGTNGMIRTSVTPWVRMITSLSEWWFEVSGKIATGSGDGPFLRLADAATSIVGCHFTGKSGRGKGFRKALQNVLGAARY